VKNITCPIDEIIFSTVALKPFINYNLCFKYETDGGKVMSVSLKSDSVALGKKFYEESLKAKLEPEHNGEFVAVEPYLGKYFVDKDEVKVMLKARAEMPDSIFYFGRIGYEYTHKIGGSWFKKGLAA
jgi:hypothetical protein